MDVKIKIRIRTSYDCHLDKVTAELVVADQVVATASKVDAHADPDWLQEHLAYRLADRFADAIRKIMGTLG